MKFQKEKEKINIIILDERMWTLSTRSSRYRNTYSTGNIINTNNIDVTQSDKQGNTNNTISIDSIDNMGVSTTCGSGKKYKQCCGK